jgi:hypothetical protein
MLVANRRLHVCLDGYRQFAHQRFRVRGDSESRRHSLV